MSIPNLSRLHPLTKALHPSLADRCQFYSGAPGWAIWLKFFFCYFYRQFLCFFCLSFFLDGHSHKNSDFFRRNAKTSDHGGKTSQEWQLRLTRRTSCTNRRSHSAWALNHWKNTQLYRLTNGKVTL